MPARVVLQDFTGVPCVVDLAAMRDAIVKLGGDAKQINPLIPSELVIDHSVQVDVFGKADSLDQNVKIEFDRNMERYGFLRWGQKALNNFKVVPPRTGIVHQVNLEFLARVVMTGEKDGATWAFPDTVFGTDSHTTMINGIGVLGWGVGGIEAEAAMLGQPSSMLIPQVVGFKLTRQAARRRDRHRSRADRHPDAAQARRRRQVRRVLRRRPASTCRSPTARRSRNMAPEYGATCGIFPIDAEALTYLRLSGRDEEQIALVEAYAKAQGMWHDANTPHARILLDAGIEPRRRQAVAGRSQASAGSCAARRRRQELSRCADRAHRQLANRRQRRSSAFCQRRWCDRGRPRRKRHRRQASTSRSMAASDLQRRLGRHRRDHLVHEHVQPCRHARRRPARAQRGQAKA